MPKKDDFIELGDITIKVEDIVAYGYERNRKHFVIDLRTKPSKDFFCDEITAAEYKKKLDLYCKGV